MGGEGLEASSVTSKPSNELQESDFSRAANSGVFSGDCHSETLPEAATRAHGGRSTTPFTDPTTDPRLTTLVRSWASLPEVARAQIARIVEEVAAPTSSVPRR